MDRLWKGFSSYATTAIFGMLLSVLVAVSAFVPQGWQAVQLAGLEHTETIRELYAWGLTDIATSYWLYGLGCLILGNLVAVGIRAISTERQRSAVEVDVKRAPHHVTLETPQPERAVEGVRNLLASTLGRPVRESVQGARVTLAFDTAPQAFLSPLLTHAGLVALLVGAVLANRPAPPQYSVARAKLEVRDSQTGRVGRFDLATQEVRQFFRWPASYSIVNYSPDRDGLGPAINMQRVDQQARRMDSFWIFLHAPAGFDARHRKGEVSIAATEMGMVPRPGAGMASRVESLLLLVGLGLLGIGVRELGRPAGELVVKTDGRYIELFGLPTQSNDGRFSSAFERWTLLTRWVLTT
ncbi:MAG: cytochrome c biogenesis protein ResB [Myxococcales bacterium]|nr:cytochrome c biogenesis protein ResB [Myxococcales bacterium]